MCVSNLCMPRPALGYWGICRRYNYRYENWLCYQLWISAYSIYICVCVCVPTQKLYLLYNLYPLLSTKFRTSYTNHTTQAVFAGYSATLGSQAMNRQTLQHSLPPCPHPINSDLYIYTPASGYYPHFKTFLFTCWQSLWSGLTTIELHNIRSEPPLRWCVSPLWHSWWGWLVSV